MFDFKRFLVIKVFFAY